jgi:hypothetical protein
MHEVVIEPLEKTSAPYSASLCSDVPGRPSGQDERRISLRNLGNLSAIWRGKPCGLVSASPSIGAPAPPRNGALDADAEEAFWDPRAASPTWQRTHREKPPRRGRIRRKAIPGGSHPCQYA